MSAFEDYKKELLLDIERSKKHIENYNRLLAMYQDWFSNVKPYMLPEYWEVTKQSESYIVLTYKEDVSFQLSIQPISITLEQRNSLPWEESKKVDIPRTVEKEILESLNKEDIETLQAAMQRLISILMEQIAKHGDPYKFIVKTFV